MVSAVSKGYYSEDSQKRSGKFWGRRKRTLAGFHWMTQVLTKLIIDRCSF